MGASQSLALANEFGVRANGGLVLSSSKNSVVRHQHDSAAEQEVKRQQKLNLAPDDQTPVHDKDLVETVFVEDGAEMSNGLNSSWGPLKAPLGIPFCPASVGGAWRSLPLVTGSGIGGYCSKNSSGELCDTEILRRRMEKIAEAHGLEGVSMDCAHLLNNGVDVYLKRLIKSCIELVGARSRHDRLNHPLLKHQAYGNAANGVWRGNHLHIQNDHMALNAMNQLKNHCPISLHDFKVAMELNPKQLVEDYPLLLEEICFHSFEE
ncbi:putative transcriptional coactivator Hfi1/Transcriptional adapter 1 [Dioscorea sansibarensis]